MEPAKPGVDATVRPTALGEDRVVAALTSLPDAWVCVHSRLLVAGAPDTALDHVVIGPGGVILIDSTAWSGTVREWQGSLVRHVMAPDGEVERRSLHAEVARAHRVARVMSARLGVPVSPVVCLSGDGAARFGAPRMVRGIWVVPVDEVAAWVAARPSTVDPDELSALQSRVSGEFASSTGARRRGPRATRATRGARGRAGRRGPTATRVCGRESRAGQRRLRRRRERFRTLLTVAFLWSVFCASVTGVMTGVLVSP